MSKWEEVEGGLDRRVYKLTSEGVEALKIGLTSIIKRKRLFEDLINFYYKNFEKSGKEEGEKGNV